MSLLKLNHNLVKSIMARMKMRPIDLAYKLRVDRQRVNYIIHHGGFSFADDLAKVFRCRRDDLLVATPSKARPMRELKKKSRERSKKK
jgi:hypothetical protein